MTEPEAIYCTLTPEELRKRRSVVRATIVPQVAAITTLADGIRLEFKVQHQLKELIEEFIELEQSCCGFLTFTLDSPAEPLTLLIQGPEESAHVIEMFRKTAAGEA